MERALQAVLDSIARCCCQPVKCIYQQTVADCLVEHYLLQVGVDSICQLGSAQAMWLQGMWLLVFSVSGLVRWIIAHSPGRTMLESTEMQ